MPILTRRSVLSYGIGTLTTLALGEAAQAEVPSAVGPPAEAEITGAFTGLNKIDRATRGARPGELWVHTGFSQAFAINVAYNLVTRYRTAVLYITLDATCDTIADRMYALHSAHSRWPTSGVPLSTVVNDLASDPTYARLEVWSPCEFSMARWVDLNLPPRPFAAEDALSGKRFGASHTLIPKTHDDVGAIIIAAPELMTPKDSILRDAKKLAQRFNNGRGVPVVLTWQASRDARIAAGMNNGVYKMGDLAWSCEDERNVDVVTAASPNFDWGVLQISNLKNRSDPCFEPFLADLHVPTLRIRNNRPWALLKVGDRWVVRQNDDGLGLRRGTVGRTHAIREDHMVLRVTPKNFTMMDDPGHPPLLVGPPIEQLDSEQDADFLVALTKPQVYKLLDRLVPYPFMPSQR